MNKENVWFKNAAQIHRYLTCEVGDEYIYGDREVATKEHGLVFRVAQKTVYNHIDAALLKSRRGAGGFAKRTVDQYAKRELGDKVQVGSKGELPEPEESEGETELARSRRTMADAEVKEVDAQLKRIKLQEKLGEIIPLHQVERELGERQQAWKLYMTSFMRDHKSEIISAVGGDLDVAKEIIALVGGDEDKAEALSGWMFARSPVLLDLFRKRIIDGLNTFAMGEWFTDDLQEAWEKWDAARKEKAADTMAQLLELVDGDPDQASVAMSRFEVCPKGDAV
ncbi:hypothetical protein [Oceanidesulfovibrio marinus]|uniref:Terminase small subunit n=1 Tax=Oceanidesulfovibrio marinus TaxID=370038 RepID=A0ABX6NHX4_9BACT|nr:hypothetical protein [Oceanidesulfovibrio marinus]QJT10248.1 hypothetical protein E8L03_15500 [Oceanidesulfovibrio marinus]